MQTEPVVRLFDILRKDEEDHITQADLKQMLNGILLSHPGLEFLQETPEFQERCDITCVMKFFTSMIKKTFWDRSTFWN